MRTESSQHAERRLSRKTKPRYFARFFHVPNYGSAAEYEFITDFASGVVQAQTRDKLVILEDITGAMSQVFPEQGRATVGAIQLTFTNARDLALYFMSAARFHLSTAMTPSDPGPGDMMTFAEIIGGSGSEIPFGGTIELLTGDPPVIERVKYTGALGPTNTLEVVQRGADDTIAADHAVGDLAVNGEQIRPGQRCQIYAGYAELDEADYMPFAKMEVVGRRLHEDGQAFVIELADIQRTLRREIFLTASEATPIVLEGSPFAILLSALTSTGFGTNGIWDLWPTDWGLGVPIGYVDADTIVDTANLASPPNFHFDIVAPVTAKDWFEQEILQPLNCYPFVTQEGLYSIRRFGGFR